MQTSEKGVAMIKGFEGFSSIPYLCPAGVWTQGYGHAIGVTRDSPIINRSEAESLLLHDLEKFENAVSKLIYVPLKQGQFDALISFVYNLGSGCLQRSTLRQKINRGDDPVSEFHKWVYAGGRKIPGLIRRRAAEARLYANQ